MWLFSWLDRRHPSPPRGMNPRRGRRRPRCGPARCKLNLERLEDRSLLNVGPLPIPGGVLDPTPFAGPDVHSHLPGPVDSATPNKVGGDPIPIYHFSGFVGAAHIEGTGTDGNGNTLFWDADLRFMKGIYRGVDGDIHKGTFAFV